MVTHRILIALLSLLAFAGCSQTMRRPVAVELSKPESKMRVAPGERIRGYETRAGVRSKFDGWALSAGDSIEFLVRDGQGTPDPSGKKWIYPTHVERTFSQDEIKDLRVRRFSVLKTVGLFLVGYVALGTWVALTWD